MSDTEKLEHYESKLKQIMIDLFAKKINKEDFTRKFIIYSKKVNYYREKLGKANLFDIENDDIDDNTILRTID